MGQLFKQTNTQQVKEKRIDQEFARIVKRKLKSNLKKIILFGSHARGDYKDSSDYDILVVLDKKDKSSQEIILDACVEIMDKPLLVCPLLFYTFLLLA